MQSYIDKIINLFLEMPRAYKRIVTVSCDVFFVASALALAIYIRDGEHFLNWVDREVLLVSAFLVPLSIGLWIKLGLYRAVIRYLDIKILSNTFWGCLGSAIIFLFLVFVFRADLPRSVPFIYLTLISIMITGSRLIVRGLVNAREVGSKIPVAIYGAGDAGRQLCISLSNSKEYAPCLFFDDNKQLQGTTIAGVKVFSPERLPELINKYCVDKVLFAIPSASISRRQEIFNQLEALQIEAMTIPSNVDLVSGRINATQLRSLEIEDLLGRELVEPNDGLLRKCNEGKTVLVTGAGGSIGSELCRKIIALKPKQLILFDVAEYNLYAIEQELRTSFSGMDIVPILGSVTDKKLVQRVMHLYSPDTVYHAAAYKHVPLVELNMARGIYNNIWGTKIVAEAALEINAKHFILISTDKAVRPTNVMGTTKRIAELVVQGLAAKSTSTIFSMVRFGNVLGSSGSVIPLFRKQIEQGRAITVTHPEITRYFMTIPEAASLVIQAGAMAKGGEVFVLDMGQPVKILDMAKKMIHLMGYSVRDESHPEGDIAIEFSGLRPGEKLYEELLVGKDASGTEHTRIMQARESSMDWAELNLLLNELASKIDDDDMYGVRETLLASPAQYSPSSTLVDLITKKQKKISTTDSVVEFGKKSSN